MRRILLVLGVALVMAAMLVSTGVPALSAPPTKTAAPCTTQSGQQGTYWEHVGGGPNPLNFSRCHQTH